MLGCTGRGCSHTYNHLTDASSSTATVDAQLAPMQAILCPGAYLEPGLAGSAKSGQIQKAPQQEARPASPAAAKPAGCVFCPLIDIGVTSRSTLAFQVELYIAICPHAHENGIDICTNIQARAKLHLLLALWKAAGRSSWHKQPYP